MKKVNLILILIVMIVIILPSVVFGEEEPSCTIDSSGQGWMTDYMFSPNDEMAKELGIYNEADGCLIKESLNGKYNIHLGYYDNDGTFQLLKAYNNANLSSYDNGLELYEPILDVYGRCIAYAAEGGGPNLEDHFNISTIEDVTYRNITDGYIKYLLAADHSLYIQIVDSTGGKKIYPVTNGTEAGGVECFEELNRWGW